MKKSAQKYPHKSVLPKGYSVFPETYRDNDYYVGKDQFISVVPHVGLLVNDIFHTDSQGWRITARSMGILKDGGAD